MTPVQYPHNSATCGTCRCNSKASCATACPDVYTDDLRYYIKYVHPLVHMDEYGYKSEASFTPHPLCRRGRHFRPSSLQTIWQYVGSTAGLDAVPARVNPTADEEDTSGHPASNPFGSMWAPQPVWTLSLPGSTRPSSLVQRRRHTELPLLNCSPYTIAL